MKEEWRDIAGYEGKYQVSNLGRVKSLNYHREGREKILSPKITNCGYCAVNIYNNGIRKHYLVHRLVAQAFIENPDNLPCVNHKDENKQNNRAVNLEWTSIKYNVRYSKAKKVGCYKDGKLIKVYDTIRDADKDGFIHGNIIACCKGKKTSCSGYQWKYIE